MKPKTLCLLLLLLFSRPAFAQIEPVISVDVLPLLGYSSNYGWDLLGLYPFVGLNIADTFLLSAFAGGGISLKFSEPYWNWTWTYQFGGNLDFDLSLPFAIGLGGGLAGPSITGESSSYPFFRVSLADPINFAPRSRIFFDYNFNDNGFRIGIMVYVYEYPSTEPAPPAPPVQVKPFDPNPTISSEELKQVELAYAETVRDIERRGKRLNINNLTERRNFINRYNGVPNTAQVSAAKNKKLDVYDIRKTSQEQIVALARKETNDFLKVRMIHDWVADIFAYDYDYLWRMNNLGTGNAVYTLREIVRLQRGVCLEYAILFWFLMDAAGVDTYLISDHSKPGVGHAYNIVLINGTGYIIDTTWDSGNRYEIGRVTQTLKMFRKDYFMPSIQESYRMRGW